MRAIDRYVLSRLIGATLSLTGAGLVVLLLGRMVGLFDLVVSPQGAFIHVGEMMLYLVPHLLGTALPAAFFFGILLTFRRLAQDSEIIVLMASGWGPHQLLRPVLALAAILLILVTVILGYVAPYARYAYRSVKFAVAQTTLVGAIREGTFLNVEGITLLAERVGYEDTQLWLSNVFLRRDEPDRSVVVTARRGWLTAPPNSAHPVLLLQEGEMAMFGPKGEGLGRGTFQEFRWPVDVSAAETYRRRGLDPRELTLTELWAARVNPPVKPSPPEISAEWNMRLVMIASIPILPLMAMALGLGRPGRVRQYGIAIGLALVILYFQAIGFGEALVKRTVLPAPLALWMPFTTFAALAALLFWVTVFGLPARHPIPRYLPPDRHRRLGSSHGSR